MKSTMKRSLAALLTLVMLFSMFAVSIQSVVAASTEDNDPCTCDKDLYAPLQEVVAPTCKDYGGTWNTCPNCGDIWVTDFQNKTDDHNWSDATEPTCTEPGNSGGECTVCGIANPDGTSLPALDHKNEDGTDAWYLIAEDENDCTTDGLKTFKCALCQATKEETVVAPGHKHVLNETDYKAPNCTEKGYTRYACSACELKVEVSYNALGHILATEGKAPTCFESGYLAAGSVTGKANDGYCTRPVTNTNGTPVEGNWTTAPVCGCTDEAYYLAPLNHSTKIDVPESMLLVDDKGDKWVDLDGDGEITEADELVAVADVCKPGEEKAGYKYFYCPTCAADPKAETVYIKVTDVVEHEWSQTYTEVITPPTCTEEGVGKYVCDSCGHTENRPIPTTPHEYTTDGAAESAIVYTFKLPNGEWYKVDGAIVWNTTGVVPTGATGAVAVDWVAQKMASCGVKGIFTHACELCDHVESLVVENKHVTPTFVKNVAATCTEGAYTVYHCANENCVSEVDGVKGDYKVYTSEALGHADKNAKGELVHLGLDADGKPKAVVVVAAQAPTCTQPGTETIYGCYVEGCELNAYIGKTAADAQVADKLNHDFANAVEVTVDPNCAHRGFKVMACGRCEAYVDNGTGVENGLPVDEAWEYRINKGKADDSAFGSILTADSDHTWNTTTPYTPGYAATCRENGRQDVYECTTCHKLKGGDYIAPLTENRVTTTIEPTCLNNGYIVSYCAHCYDVTTFNAAAYAANPAAYVFADKTDATKTTYHTVTVTASGAIANNGGHKIKGAVYHEDGRVDLTNAVAAPSYNGDHVINAGSCASEPLNLHNGYYVCKNCDEEIEFYVHLVHTVTTAADCDDAAVCDKCHETVAEKLGHLYDDPSTTAVDTKGITVVNGTCAERGSITYKCFRDGCTYEETFYEDEDGNDLYPQLAHQYNIDAETCTADKYCTRTCCKNPTTGRVIAGIEDKNGGLSFIAKLGHLYDDPSDDVVDTKGIVITAPTCTAKGYTTKTCYRCDDVTVTDYVNTIAHKPAKELFDERAATCTTFGFRNHVCEMCGEYYDFAENKFYPAQGHIMVPVAATCETVAYEYCSVCNASQSTTQDATPDWKGDYNYKVTGEALKHVLFNEEGEEDDVLFENICVDLKDIVDEKGNVTCDRCDVTFAYDNAHTKSDPQSTANCHDDGYSYWYCTVEGCSEKKITGFDAKKEHNFEYDPTHEDWKNATVSEAGLKVQVCTNCGKTPVCEDCIIKTPYTIEGVIVSAKAQNMYGADYHIVNNGIVAYTISIKAAEASFYSFKVDVAYNTDVLTYIGYNLGTDHVNIFGSRVNTIGTAVNAADGMLGFYGFNQNPESEEKTNVTLTSEQEFVTVYFRVNADVRSDAASDAAVVKSAITLGEVSVLTAEDVKFTAEQIEKSDAAAIEIHKLGDATDDAVLASEDISAIKSHILAGTYDARLDINVDGFVSADDLILLAQKYVYTYTYEDICGMNVEFDPALSDAEFDPELA